ncbi:predicted protein [Uncinocarpus reesii 1704]|uniref:Mid2 domain-containing protein n=1 Tax=Uncinocarpus reesii (strain UAMH 1704) TaxID=336963 RepID=C4JZ97_UNCRE|nr:uncharacterized protein UREG_07498 [Uncinocarpus reesii 1704]EEP82633.1 predicted protein [Uncinocarpus reesii 1704]
MRWPSTFSFFLLSLLVLAIVVSGADLDRRQLEIEPQPSPQTPANRQTGEETSTTPESTSSTTSERTEPSSTPPTTSERPTPTTPTAQPTPTAPSSTPEPPTPTNDPRPTPPKPTPTRDPQPPPPPGSSVVIVTRTITSDDQTIIQTTPSSVPDATNAPGLGKEKGQTGSSGLSESNRNIIIGVVVGVGGAIILGGLAVVIYRLRRKRNARTEPDEDDLTGTALGSHSHEASMTNSPFKTTLDQYHNPGPVNPASNF